MNTKHEDRSLDAVLFRFHREVTNPTPEVVASWSRHYPECAAEIQAHAVEMLDLESRNNAKAANMDALESEARSAGLNAVYEAKQRSVRQRAASLREAAEQAGIRLRDLADSIGIARAVVVDVDSGSIRPETVTTRFLRTVSQKVGQSLDTLRDAIAQAQQGGMREGVAYKASGTPTPGRPRTWREAIEASDMPDDRKSYWLIEDD